MNFKRFQQLKEVDKFTLDNLEEGEYFLMGESMIEQKHKKKPGKVVVFYQVIKKQNKRVSYRQVFEKLEGKE